MKNPNRWVQRGCGTSRGLLLNFLVTLWALKDKKRENYAAGSSVVAKGGRRQKDRARRKHATFENVQWKEVIGGRRKKLVKQANKGGE